MNDDPTIVCCLLGLCCPAGSPEQRVAAIRLIRWRHPALTAEQAGARADALLGKYDHFREVAALVGEPTV